MDLVESINAYFMKIGRVVYPGQTGDVFYIRSDYYFYNELLLKKKKTIQFCEF